MKCAYLKRIATWGCTVTGVLLFCWGQIDIIWRNMIWCKLFQIHHLIIYLLELNQSISIWKRAVLQLPWRGLQHVARIIMIIKYSKKKTKQESINCKVYKCLYLSTMTFVTALFAGVLASFHKTIHLFLLREKRVYCV